jgi:hypothetical protein
VLEVWIKKNDWKLQKHRGKVILLKMLAVVLKVKPSRLITLANAEKSQYFEAIKLFVQCSPLNWIVESAAYWSHKFLVPLFLSVNLISRLLLSLLCWPKVIQRRPIYQKRIIMDLKKVIKIRACNEPEARKRTWCANPFVVVQDPCNVTMTNIRRWAWNGVQQTKKTNTTAAEKKRFFCSIWE